MSIKSLSLSWIVVADLNSALEYFTKVIGLELKERSDQYGWAELMGKEGARLGIAEESSFIGMKAGSNAVVTLTVENLEKTIAELTKKHVRFLGDVMEVPCEVKMQSFLDADGNQFQLVEMLRK